MKDYFEDPKKFMDNEDRDGCVYILAYLSAAFCVCVIAVVLGLMCLGVVHLITK